MKKKIFLVFIVVFFLGLTSSVIWLWYNQQQKLNQMSQQLIDFNSQISALDAKLQVSTSMLTAYQEQQTGQFNEQSAAISGQTQKLNSTIESVARYLQLNHTLCAVDLTQCESGGGKKKGFVISRDNKNWCHVPEDQSIIEAFNQTDVVLVEKFKNAWTGSQYPMDAGEGPCYRVSLVGPG